MASLIQLQYALELAREKSFSRAAKKSFVTQPTLSMQIQKLEEEYEIAIFDRSRKPVAPTQDGLVLLGQFQAVIDAYQKIEQMVYELKGDLMGQYRLAVIPTIAPMLLPKVLKIFHASYPKVHLTAMEMTTGEIMAALNKGGIDAGILSTPLEHPLIKEVRLFEEPLYLYHSKDLPLKIQSNGTVRRSDLPLDHLLVLTEGNCLRTQTLDFCALKEQSAKSLGFDIEASSLLTLIQLVQEGPFFTIIPHMAAQMLGQKERELQVKKFAGPMPVREIGLVTHRSQIKARIDAALVEIIQRMQPELELSGVGRKGKMTLSPL